AQTTVGGEDGRDRGVARGDRDRRSRLKAKRVDVGWIHIGGAVRLSGAERLEVRENGVIHVPVAAADQPKAIRVFRFRRREVAVELGEFPLDVGRHHYQPTRPTLTCGQYVLLGDRINVAATTLLNVVERDVRAIGNLVDQLFDRRTALHVQDEWILDPA